MSHVEVYDIKVQVVIKEIFETLLDSLTYIRSYF